MKYAAIIVSLLIYGFCFSDSIPFHIHFQEVVGFQGPPFIIGARRAGLFSNLLGVIHNMQWAQNHNRTPIVYWDNASLYYDDTITDTNNVWEYYFYPVSSLTYQTSDPIWLHYYDPDRGELNYHKKTPFFSNTAIRAETSAFFNTYIHVKKHIKRKIQRFYLHYIKDIPTIGIHLRGTDKDREVKPVNPQVIFNKANELADQIGAMQFFVATDEEPLLQKAIAQLNRPVIYYDSYRSSDGKPLHTRPLYPKYKLGEDVLVEAYLLSKCDYFVHTRSNVAIGVCIINADLKNIYLEH